MYSSSSSNQSFYNQSANIQEASKAISEALEESIFAVAYKPYLEQTKLNDLLDKKNLNSENAVKHLLSTGDVNGSNNLGITLLHALLFAERFDLAMLVAQDAKFNKINYKFCLPTQQGSMYTSALDLAIIAWLTNSPSTLELIETMLKMGAIVPNPVKKFLDGEFTSIIYPHLVFQQKELDDEIEKEKTAGIVNEDETSIAKLRNKEEIIELFCLLHKYGFSIASMQENMLGRLFNDDRAAEFAESAGLSVEIQKNRLSEFFLHLNDRMANTLVDGKVNIEMTAERLSNGEDTLRLTFDPTDRPCIIM